MDRSTLEELPVPSTTRTWPPIGYWTRVALAVAAVVVGLWIVGMLLDTILIVVASFALATGLQPAVKWLERRGIKRTLALAAILLAGLLITGGLIGLLLPVVVAQVDDVIAQVPGYIETLQAGDGLLARLVSMLGLDRIGESVSGDPEMAIGALKTVRDAGLQIPRDISIVGFDDHEMAAFMDLTTVAQPAMQQGETAATLLLEQMRSDACDLPPTQIVLPTKMVVRATTGPYRSIRTRAG